MDKPLRFVVYTGLGLMATALTLLLSLVVAVFHVDPMIPSQISLILALTGVFSSATIVLTLLNIYLLHRVSVLEESMNAQ